ncbi:unnamed protein product, partial [marine sediment metagenome]
ANAGEADVMVVSVDGAAAPVRGTAGTPLFVR